MPSGYIDSQRVSYAAPPPPPAQKEKEKFPGLGNCAHRFAGTAHLYCLYHPTLRVYRQLITEYPRL